MSTVDQGTVAEGGFLWEQEAVAYYDRALRPIIVLNRK